MDRTLDGKVAVVTAGSTGFGRAIAVAFGRRGAKVVVGDLREDPTPGNFDERPELATAALIEASGGEAVYLHCDVRLRNDVRTLVDTAVEQFGRLDVMVNNAGVYRGGRLMHEMDEDDLDACLDVLVKGSWFGAQEAIRVFLAQDQGGCLINVVSTAGLRAHHLQTPYNVAKAAQANLTRCLALDYARYNIRANAICPTYARTSMSRAAVDDPELDSGIRSAIPLGRWGEAADVASLACYLASDAASFLTGTLIPMDGGETAGLYRPQ